MHAVAQERVVLKPVGECQNGRVTILIGAINPQEESRPAWMMADELLGWREVGKLFARRQLR